jgi:hypothetical protein
MPVLVNLLGVFFFHKYVDAVYGVDFGFGVYADS